MDWQDVTISMHPPATASPLPPRSTRPHNPPRQPPQRCSLYSAYPPCFLSLSPVHNAPALSLFTTLSVDPPCHCSPPSQWICPVAVHTLHLLCYGTPYTARPLWYGTHTPHAHSCALWTHLLPWPCNTVDCGPALLLITATATATVLPLY